jgi:hypothetical protein
VCACRLLGRRSSCSAIRSCTAWCHRGCKRHEKRGV